MNMKNRIELEGIAVCNPKRVGNTVKVTIANNRYKRLSDGSSEQEALYMQVTCFNQLAEVVQSSVQKGFFVIGTLLLSMFPDALIAITNQARIFWKAEEIRHAISMDLKVNHGLGVILESVILGLIFYKLFIKRDLVGLLKIRSVLMLAISTIYTMFLLYSVFAIHNYSWF